MKTRVYSIYTYGKEENPILFHDCNFLGPADVELTFRAFFGFYLKYLGGRYMEAAIFAAPTTLDEVMCQPRHIVRFASSGRNLGHFRRDKVMEQLYDKVEDIWEDFEEKRLEFVEWKQGSPALENLAWKY